MTFIRVFAVLLAATLAAPPVLTAQDQQQNRKKAEAQDFRMFLHSISVRGNARVCERSVPEYDKKFIELYGKWSDKHHDEIARGESLFKDALTKKDLKEYPYTNRAALVRAEASLAELANPAKAAEPVKPHPQTTVACEKLLTFLKTE